MGFNKKYVSMDMIKYYLDINEFHLLEKMLKKADAIIATDKIAHESIDIIMDDSLTKEEKIKFINFLFVN